MDSVSPVIVISSSDEEQNYFGSGGKARETVVYVSSSSYTSDDDHNNKSRSYLDLRRKKRFSVRKRRKKQEINRFRRRDLCEEAVDDDLPELILKSEDSNFTRAGALFQSEKEENICLCTIKCDDKLSLNHKTHIKDHMVLNIGPYNQKHSSCNPHEKLVEHSKSFFRDEAFDCQRQIAEEKQTCLMPVGRQAISYSDHLEEEITTKQKKRSSDYENNYDVYGLGKHKVCHESQTASLTLSTIHLQSHSLDSEMASVSAIHSIKLEEKKEFSSPIILKKDIFSPASALDKEEKIVITRKGNLFSSFAPLCQNTSAFETKDPKLKRSRSYLASKFKDLTEKDIFKNKIDDLYSNSKSLVTNEPKYSHLYYLKRNESLCLYRMTYLPFHISKTRNLMSYYHSNLINFLLESKYAEGLYLLDDLSSSYIPDNDLLYSINETIFTVKETREKNLIHSIYLSLLQKFPNVFVVTGEKLRCILSGSRKNKFEKDTPSTLQIFMLIQALELNIFTLNLCDNAKVRCALIHSSLSMDVGKQNVIHILGTISKCVDQMIRQRTNMLPESSDSSRGGKFWWLSSLQHLIHLGLLTTKNVMNAVLVIAKVLKSLYLSLPLMQDKIIFLETIEHPLLCLAVVLDVLDKLNVPISTGESLTFIPSFISIIQSFWESIRSETFSSSTNYEELIILLYFSLRSTITCKQEHIVESLRSRILQPGNGSVTITITEKRTLLQHLDDLQRCFNNTYHNLTSVAFQYFVYTKCLIDSLDVSIKIEKENI